MHTLGRKMVFLLVKKIYRIILERERERERERENQSSTYVFQGQKTACVS